jgi:hypothetical protein
VASFHLPTAIGVKELVSLLAYSFIEIRIKKKDLIKNGAKESITQSKRKGLSREV